MTDKHRFLTITEAAEFLQVSETSLRRWTNNGTLRCFRVGGRNERRFLKEDLLAFMQKIDLQFDEPPQEIETYTSTPDELDSDPLIVERHICMFFANKEEQWQMLSPYIIEHLRSDVPVLYIQDTTPPERLKELIAAEGFSVVDLISQGLLKIIPPEAAYLLTGRFDVHRMLAFIESSILGAIAAGHDRALLTGEMTWSLPSTPGAEGMMTYEELLNPLVDKYPGVTIICQYDVKRFDGPKVLDALLTHPSVHVSSGRVAGFYGL
jgi:excisionase family DNA binding protein